MTVKLHRRNQRAPIAWSAGASGGLRLADPPEARPACAGEDPEIFFSASPPDIARAKAACTRCPIRAACLETALAGGIGEGTWGGLTEDERRELPRSPRSRPKSAAPGPVRSGQPRTSPLPELTDGELERYHAKVAPGGCGVTWAGGIQHGTGILRIRRDGRQLTVVAHRLAYQLATGRDPGADDVTQRCGGRLCLTPACLVARPRSVRRQPLAAAS